MENPWPIDINMRFYTYRWTNMIDHLTHRIQHDNNSIPYYGTSQLITNKHFIITQIQMCFMATQTSNPHWASYITWSHIWRIMFIAYRVIMRKAQMYLIHWISLNDIYIFRKNLGCQKTFYNCCFSFHVFLVFYAISNIFRRTNFQGGGGANKMLEKQVFLISCFLRVLCYLQHLLEILKSAPSLIG